jgi:CheY-like chemotaxis protein
VQPWPRHQRGQALHELQRRHHDVRGAVAPGSLELEHHLPGAGRGSAFTVSLPTLEPLATGQPAQLQDTRADSGKLRILLADDNVDFAASLAILLESCRHEVAVTHDGMQALEKAPGFRRDLCFLDIGLPRLHGYDLARRLRELPATRNAVLVAASGWGQPEDKRRSREAGFHRHMANPVEFEKIRELLDEFAAARQAS